MEGAKSLPGRAFCPSCGRKYAVPEAELRRRVGVRFRATCRFCDTPFSVWWENGQLTTAVEEILDEPVSDRDVLKTGARIGNYELEDALASGGSATVYSAFDWGANRKVALKVLHREPDSDYGMRFRREVEVQGNLKHPNLMPIFDHGTFEGKPYYTMELLQKPATLDTVFALFRADRLGYNPSLRSLNSVESLLRRVVLPVARAIGFANQNGIIHRDLKPTNIIVDATTLRVYVIDFGICHLFREAGSRIVLRAGETREDEEEQRRRMMGTVRCMPPEQAHGSVSPQGDVWSLGALVYFLLQGDYPIAPAIDLSRVGLEKRLLNLEKLAKSCREAGDEDEAAFYDARIEEIRTGAHRTMRDLVRDAQNAHYVPLPDGVHPTLAAIVRRAMAVEPERRYPDAETFAAEIRAFLDGRPVAAYAGSLSSGSAALYRARLFARRNRSALVTAAVVILVGAIAWTLFMVRSSSEEERNVRQWLFEARRSADPAYQEERLDRILAVRPKHQEAKDLLAHVRKYAPLLKLVREARAVKEEVKGLIGDRRGEEAQETATDMAAVLERSVLPDLRSLPPDFPGRRFEAEAQQIANYLRQRRVVTIKEVPKGVEVLLVSPRSQTTREFDWERARSWGVAPLAIASQSIEAGPYVLLLRGAADGPALYLPFVARIRKDPKPIDVTCPMDPADIPAGMVFVAGSRNMEYGDLRFTEETERITVKPFFLDTFEVTNAQYATYLETLEPARREAAVPRRLLSGPGARTAPLWQQRDGGRWTYPDGAAKHPVTGISLLDARAYAHWAGKRLPTPQEWELAARGPDRRDYPFGMQLDRGACNAASGSIAAAGAFPRDRSPYGAYDMAGNVTEWTASLGGESAVVKGGSFDKPRYRAMAAAFDRILADQPYPDVGFRCARDVD